MECPYLRRVLGENFTELADLPLGSVADPDMLDIQIRGGGGGGGHPDPGLRGMPSLEKIFFRPFGPQFGLKIRGGGGWERPSPTFATEVVIVWGGSPYSFAGMKPWKSFT